MGVADDNGSQHRIIAIASFDFGSTAQVKTPLRDICRTYCGAFDPYEGISVPG
jgi:hypothetical protein